MKQLYFVRHGESELNVRRIFAGQIDTPLTAQGKEQARAAGAQVQDLHIEVIVSSPLSRALETAQIIADVIGYPRDQIIVNDIFKERSFGSLEGKSWDEYPEDSSVFPDIETDEALLARAQTGLDYLQSLAADNVLLVGHGSFYRMLRLAIEPSSDYPEPSNAEVVQLV